MPTSDPFISVVEYLTYKSYAFNREHNPQIAIERWAAIYPSYKELEEKYKEQKLLRNHECTNK